MVKQSQCLELLPPGGRFMSAAQIAQHTGANADEALATLFAMYQDHRLDRLLLIAGTTLTGYYGRHRAVQPGSTRNNTATMKGNA